MYIYIYILFPSWSPNNSEAFSPTLYFICIHFAGGGHEESMSSNNLNTHPGHVKDEKNNLNSLDGAIDWPLLWAPSATSVRLLSSLEAIFPIWRASFFSPFFLPPLLHDKCHWQVLTWKLKLALSNLSLCICKQLTFPFPELRRAVGGGGRCELDSRQGAF